jgi:protein SCO1/2
MRWSLLTLLGVAAATPAVSAPLDPASLAAISPPPFAAAPMQLPFRDQRGRTVTLASVGAGHPILLAPVQHQCRNLCGLTLEALRTSLAAAQLTPGRGVTVVAFGVDPRERPADAAQSAARLGGPDAPGVTALVGDGASEAAVTNALGYRYSWVPATGQYAHLAAVAVLTRDGRLVRWLPGLGVSPTALRTAVVEAGRGRAPGLVDQIRLLCFHFDPASGRYTLAVWRLLQWGAAGAAALLAGGVGYALWRERRAGAAA